MVDTTEQPRIIDSARRHGVADDDMRHAFRNPMRVFDVEDDMTMYVGPSHSSELLEVGSVDSEDGPAIVHAMRARPKYLDWR